MLSSLLIEIMSLGSFVPKKIFNYFNEENSYSTMGEDLVGSTTSRAILTMPRPKFLTIWLNLVACDIISMEVGDDFCCYIDNVKGSLNTFNNYFCNSRFHLHIGFSVFFIL
jgi:hypothetical protein